MTEHHFETHQPVDLVVEIGRGRLEVTCTDTTESVVRLRGDQADDVLVEQDGPVIRVLEPKRGVLRRDAAIEVQVTVPLRSAVSARTGSADIRVTGTARTGELRSGSGEVHAERFDGALRVETGSGDVHLDSVGGELRVKTGSGEVALGEVADTLTASAGSGDVRADLLRGPATVKTGSGDLHIREAGHDVNAATGSGDVVVDRLHRGRFTAKGASGDIRVGVPAGVPVWTDLLTVSGRIRSSLEGAGQPEEGQDHVELRLKTVSGDIELVQV